MTSIEWTRNADGTQGKSWNPVVGCTILSPGCTNCYAMRMAARLEAMDEGSFRARVEESVDLAHDRDQEERIRAEMNNSRVPSHYAGLTKPSKAGPVWTGKVALAPERTLTEPLRRRKPTTWFVNSMSDLFHEAILDEWVDRIFAVMALCPQHTFIVLTKRSARMRAYLTTPYRPGQFRTILDDGSEIDTPAANVRVHSAMCDAFKIAPARALNDACDWNDKHYPGDGFIRRWPLPNVWLGVTTERQQEADERIPDLLATPAAVRLVSAEPLLGPVDLALALDGPRLFARLAEQMGIPDETAHPDPHTKTRLDWVIVGGESGPGARPMHPGWARSIRDQCASAGVPFFFKQWGANAPASVALPGDHLDEDADTMCRVGKSRAGRLLDGIEHSEMPSARTTEAA